MRVTPTQWLNIAAVAGIGAMMVATGLETSAFGRSGIDPTTTASVAQSGDTRTDRFMAIDHVSDRSCIMTLHRARGYDVHRVEPGLDCAELGDLFSRARAWREDRRGTVTVTDHRGKTLLRMAHSDGFAFDVIYPRDMRVSMAAY